MSAGDDDDGNHDDECGHGDDCTTQQHYCHPHRHDHDVIIVAIESMNSLREAPKPSITRPPAEIAVSAEASRSRQNIHQHEQVAVLQKASCNLARLLTPHDHVADADLWERLDKAGKPTGTPQGPPCSQTIYIYIYMYVHILIHTHIYTHVFMYKCIHMAETRFRLHRSN